jgi:hypothetical protein
MTEYFNQRHDEENRSKDGTDDLETVPDKFTRQPFEEYRPPAEQQ